MLNDKQLRILGLYKVLERNDRFKLTLEDIKDFYIMTLLQIYSLGSDTTPIIEEARKMAALNLFYLDELEKQYNKKIEAQDKFIMGRY